MDNTKLNFLIFVQPIKAMKMKIQKLSLVENNTQSNN